MKECNKRDLYYFNKKTKEDTVTYDQVIRATQYITRANDRSKTIENKKAKALLAAIHDELSKSEDGKIWIDHDFIFEITECQTNQSSNILAQLADILDAQYHRSLYFDGKTRHYGYTVEYTLSGVERLIHPEKFYELRSKKVRKRSGKIIAHTTKNSCSYHKKMGVMPQKIVASTIYRDIEINKIDNHDNQYDQFSTYKNFSTENVETEGAKIVNAETVENSELPVAREECKVRKEYNTETVEQVETSIASDYVLRSTMETEEYTDEDDYIEANDFTDIPMEVLEPPTYEDDEEYEVEAKPESKPAKVKFVESPESLKGTQDITSYHRKRRTVETVGKDGKSYNSLRLDHLRLEEEMLQEAISRSNKPNYATSRVVVIIRNILEKRPDTLIFGGRRGAINYLVKAINGENDYEYKAHNPQTHEEKALSMAEIQAEKQKAIDERYQMLLRGEVQSLSGAERYYG